MDRIPKAPKVPPTRERPPNCKIVIVSGKIDEAYCILRKNLEQGPQKGTFKLAGTKIIIGEISANLFLHPEIKALIAIPVPKEKGMYVLQPLQPEQYKKYIKGELKSKDIKPEYKKSISGYKGTYGEVQIYPTQGVAVKKSINRLETGEMPPDIVAEIGIYKLLSEIACLPKLYSFIPGKSIQLQLEKGTVLSEVMETPLTDEQMLQIMFRSAKCLRTIASQGVIHADLKPGNMVVSPSGQILIIDWGMAQIDKSKDQQRSKTTIIQTLWWRAPEILNEPPLEKYSCKIDIFSLGIIFIEIYVGRQGLIPGKDEAEQQRTLLRKLLNWNRDELTTRKSITNVFTSVVTGGRVAGKIKERLLEDPVFRPVNFSNKGKPMSDMMADLISKMLEFNPKYRIDYDEIVLHPFFQYIKRENIPKLPIFINNMPIMPTIPNIWTISMQGKPVASPKMRAILFSWMTEIAVEIGFGYEALLLSWQLMDLFVYFRPDLINQKTLQEYGAAAALLAGKVYKYTVDTIEILPSSKNLVLFEREMFDALAGNIIIPTLYSYISHYNGYKSLEKGPHVLVQGQPEIATDITKYYFDRYMQDNIYQKPFSETWK